MSETYVATEADNRRSMIHAAAGLLKGTAAGDAEGVLAAAEKFHAWAHGTAAPAAAEAAKPTRTRKPAADKAPAAETVKTAAEPDILGDGEGDGFLSDEAESVLAEEKVAPAKKLTIDDVRAALLKLQKDTDAYTARAVLSKNADGADTLGKIKPEKYQAVVDAAVKQGTAKIAQPAK